MMISDLPSNVQRPSNTVRSDAGNPSVQSNPPLGVGRWTDTR